ncbi:MAG: DUF1657 domain-containing protein [Clostridium sp.]|jgi:broad specificity polyphosphatase/5'/3'-nucleotidase SurE|uniref:DUF1657 domain-containing protein n=1 Tax=Clostridium sp. TaxID=1506 RepID=UPI0025BBE6D8|nr:DUF1657 domain-containing protein [Clostridium sp.]MCH3963659.1 DUF1657 domain-containing protein [Clostridium sp.]MCI1714800.1 DUF1657 domain-containing protein [Clostridium sp.]MCI1799011.1 DUF1657 domain-containing protein [Clostridium sp.]MCI1812983.1 DUF1657 domain-containing protein [Clostridium sp.]MCI1869873.1 DUF1657 domain-containing protein [Clostridium sp.]
MTVGTQMQQVIAGVQSAAASMKTFALQTEDQTAKQDFQQLAKTFEDALQVLNGRLKYIQEQEVQYR